MESKSLECKNEIRPALSSLTNIQQNAERKRFTYDFFNTEFSLLHHLRRHKTIHTGEKCYACDICQTKFSRKDYLHQHKRIHTGEKPHKCEICDNLFLIKVI